MLFSSTSTLFQRFPLRCFGKSKVGKSAFPSVRSFSEKGNKVVVISLRVPGGDIRVEERAFTFEEAIDNSMDIIKRQLEKAKAKFEK